MPKATCNPGPCVPSGRIIDQVDGAWTKHFQNCANCGQLVFLARTQTRDHR